MKSGGLSHFSVKIFWSHSAEKVRGHPLNVSENLGYRKILCIIGGITIFRQKFFVSVSKNFVKEPFSVSLISGIKKCYGKIVKIFGMRETRTSNLLLENGVVLTLLLFLNGSSECIIFVAYYICCEK